MKLKLSLIIYCYLIMLFTAPAWAQKSPVVYTDITKQAGIDFRYTFGDTTYENILESSGSGVTILDYDSDGDMDLYMLNGTYLERLYQM